MKSILPPIHASERAEAQAGDWLKKYGPGLHRSLTFSDSQPALAPNGMPASDYVDAFCAVVETFRASNSQHHFSDFNIYGKHTWAEVLQIAQLAAQKYEADAKGKKGAVRKFFREAGNFSLAIEPWIGLLPSDNHMSILSGGLKLVLGMAARRSEQREEIFKALDRVPDTINKTYQYYKLFPQDKTLQDCVWTLYLAILEMIEKMLLWLDKSVWGKVKDGIKGKLSNMPLQQSIEACGKKMEALQDHMSRLQTLLNVDTNAKVTEMQGTLCYTKTSILQTKNLTEDTNSRTIVTQKQVESIGNSLNSIELQRKGTMTEAFEMMKQHLAPIFQIALWNNEKVRYLEQVLTQTRPSTPEREQALYLRRSQKRYLLEYLVASPNAPSHNLNLVFRCGHDIDVSSQNQAQWLLRFPRFRHWLWSNSTDLLIVNGNSERYASERISPMSLLCSSLIKLLEANKSAKVIYFFCGLGNSSTGNERSGPLDLMKDLTAQLLMLYELDLTFINCQQWRKKFDEPETSLNLLCELLWNLFQRLPDGILFCIIDGLSLYEVERWWDEISEVMGLLQNIAKNDSIKATIKILITNPGINRCAKDFVPPGDLVWIPEGVDRDENHLTDKIFQNDISYERSRRTYEADCGFNNEEENIFDHGCE